MISLVAAAATRPLNRLRTHSLALWIGCSAVVVVALGGGLVGTYHYLDNYWLYRGFAPPKDPAYVVQKGRLTGFTFASAALGGRRQPVDVYLPPGYAGHPADRYPVIYLLHGFPGVPSSYFKAGRLGVVIALRLHGHPGGALRVDLRGFPTGNGVTMDASGVSFVPATTRTVYLGSVTALEGNLIGAHVRDAAGDRLNLMLSLSLDQSSGAATGSVHGESGEGSGG